MTNLPPRKHRALPKNDGKKWKALLRMHRAAVVGWCYANRPNANAAEYEMMINLTQRPFCFWMARIDCDDDDAMVGPYTYEQGVAFAKEGVEIMSVLASAAGVKVSRVDLGDNW